MSIDRDFKRLYPWVEEFLSLQPIPLLCYFRDEDTNKVMLFVRDHAEQINRILSESQADVIWGYYAEMTDRGERIVLKMIFRPVQSVREVPSPIPHAISFLIETGVDWYESEFNLSNPTQMSAWAALQDQEQVPIAFTDEEQRILTVSMSAKLVLNKLPDRTK